MKRCESGVSNMWYKGEHVMSRCRVMKMRDTFKHGVVEFISEASLQDPCRIDACPYNTCGVQFSSERVRAGASRASQYSRVLRPCICAKSLNTVLLAALLLCAHVPNAPQVNHYANPNNPTRYIINHNQQR